MTVSLLAFIFGPATVPRLWGGGPFWAGSSDSYPGSMHQNPGFCPARSLPALPAFMGFGADCQITGSQAVHISNDHLVNELVQPGSFNKPGAQNNRIPRNAALQADRILAIARKGHPKGKKQSMIMRSTR